MHRIYTNDLERERLRQQAYAETENRLALNRHRIRRARARQLKVICVIAHERGDRTIEMECRTRLYELGELVPGATINTTYELVESRRPARATRYGFASNRLIRFNILPERVLDTFPLGESRALAAAEANHLV